MALLLYISCMFSEAPFVLYIMLLLDHSSFSLMILDLLLLYSIMYEKKLPRMHTGQKSKRLNNLYGCMLYDVQPSSICYYTIRALYNVLLGFLFVAFYFKNRLEGDKYLRREIVLQSQLPLLGWPAPNCMLCRN